MGGVKPLRSYAVRVCRSTEGFSQRVLTLGKGTRDGYGDILTLAIAEADLRTEKTPVDVVKSTLS